MKAAEVTKEGYYLLNGPLGPSIVEALVEIDGAIFYGTGAFEIHHGHDVADGVEFYGPIDLDALKERLA